MSDHMTLILADNVETGQFRAAILKQRAIESDVVRFGSNNSVVKVPDRYDLVVIDSHDSAEAAKFLIQRIRGQSTVPFILLTNEADVRYHLDAYAIGVDECVTKPVSELLFLAKVTAWIRHKENAPLDNPPQKPKHDTVSYNGFTLNSRGRSVSTKNGESIRLSDLEFRLLQLFLLNHGRVLETNQLLRNVWNYQDVDARLLTNLVYRLRQKLATTSVKVDHIKTIERIGYMFE